MKILRFDDDKIGVIKNDNMVVDVSDTISSRKAKGPQRVIEEIIEGWRKYRRRFEKILAEQEGVPLSSVKLLCPLPRPSKCLAAFVNYVDRPDRSPDSLPNEYFYKSPDLVGPGGTIELRDIPAAVVYQPEAEFAFVMPSCDPDISATKFALNANCTPSLISAYFVTRQSSSIRETTSLALSTPGENCASKTISAAPSFCVVFTSSAICSRVPLKSTRSFWMGLS